MVYINMPFPRNCDECKLMIKLFVAYDELYGCAITRNTKGKHKPERPHDCPLTDAEDDYK